LPNFDKITPQKQISRSYDSRGMHVSTDEHLDGEASKPTNWNWSTMNGTTSR
jgi:hypothetical protein